MSFKEQYLGDAVYASFDGYQVKLMTGDGGNQVIYLEPSVLNALFGYYNKIVREQNSIVEEEQE